MADSLPRKGNVITVISAAKKALHFSQAMTQVNTVKVVGVITVVVIPVFNNPN
jgi:hypothetical protein